MKHSTAVEILIAAALASSANVFVQGNVVRGRGHPEATAFWIHSRIHEVHPVAGCVVHTHSPWATALTLLEDPTWVAIL